MHEMLYSLFSYLVYKIQWVWHSGRDVQSMAHRAEGSRAAHTAPKAVHRKLKWKG